MESTVTVNVLDVNEPPSLSGATTLRVPEDSQQGQPIARVTASDADLEEQLSFTVTRGYGDFMINNMSCLSEVSICQKQYRKWLNNIYRNFFSLIKVLKDF